MTTIKEVIKGIIDKFSSLNGYKKAWIEKHWLELIGEAAAVHALPYKVESNILFVRVDSSVWNQELFMTRRNLIQKINGNFSQAIVKEIKYQIGHFAAAESKAPQKEVPLPQFGDFSEISRGGLVWDEIVLHSLQKKRERE